MSEANHAGLPPMQIQGEGYIEEKDGTRTYFKLSGEATEQQIKELGLMPKEKT